MFKGLAVAALAGLAVLASGCTQTSGTPTAPPASVEESLPLPMTGLSPRQRLRRSLELLEEGDERTARVELVEYVSAVPRSRTGRSLLKQIDMTAQDYFPAEYRELKLEAGQSLSTVAKVYLGSAVQFHALAKYNGILRPKRVVPGQVVRVPLTEVAREAFAIADSGLVGDLADVEVEVPVGEPEEASMLSEGRDANPGVDPRLAEEDGSSTPSVGASGVLPGAADAAAERTGEDLAQPSTDVENALTEFESEALEDESRAPVDPDIDVDSLHRQAITAYRSQDLDTAIELWDQILAADPDYESARLYRSQARTLKERLKSLN